MQVRFAPQTVDTVIDTLYIANNSSNQPIIKIRLTGRGEFVPPRNPENVLINMDGNSAVISWDAVTHNMHDSPIVPDGYLVYFNGSDDVDNGPYYFLAVTANLTHTHVRVGEFAEHMFYRVKAYKYYGRGRFDISAAKLEQGMTEIQVMDRLNNAIR